MRLKTGRTSSERRRAVTSASVFAETAARRLSEKPIALTWRKAPGVVGRPNLRTFSSVSTIPRICSRNQGSILQLSWICASVKPKRIACATWRMRSGVGVESAALIAFLSSPLPIPSTSISSRPSRPVSSERRAFCRLSWKVRPIAIASPTDFMAVVSVGSAPGNFSKAKRGILVTT